MTRGSKEVKMFAKTYPFPPLASATPRLLFDFSSRFDESLRLRYDQHRTSQSLFFLEALFLCPWCFLWGALSKSGVDNL